MGSHDTDLTTAALRLDWSVFQFPYLCLGIQLVNTVKFPVPHSSTHTRVPVLNLFTEAL